MNPGLLKTIVGEVRQAEAIDRILYLIRGVSGTGKSALAATLAPCHVAADYYPGIYNEAGEYQIQHQAESHIWCLETTKTWLERGEPRVAVHNTFTRLQFLEPYIELGKAHGYSVQVIQTEGVVLPSGEPTQNVHGVPPDILKYQQESWQPFLHRPES